MTLLEKAQAHIRPRRRSAEITGEELELALAWLSGRVPYGAVTKVLREEKLATNVYGRLCVILQEAYRRGRIQEA
jgi:hypothetical protein